MRKTELFLLIKNRNLTRKAHNLRVNRFLSYSATALTAVVALALVAALLGVGILYARVADNLPSIQVLPVLLNAENGELLQPSRLLDSSGQQVLFTYQDPGIERKYLYLNPDHEDHVSPQLIRTVIAEQEPSFWESPGYDLKHWNDPEPHTIAERLADDLLLQGEPASQTRNFRMRLLAGQVTTEYSKTRVLEWYLNSAWFGHYAYGVESAAQLYLGKSAGSLTLAESALLTPLLESPALNPLDAPDAALKNQRAFLKEMLKSGTINKQEYDLAAAEKLNLRKSVSSPDSSAPGFVRQVERQLENTLGSQRVQRGGVDVITTLDAGLQQQLRCTTETQLSRVQYSNISGVAPSETDCDAALLLPTQSFLNPSIEGLTSGGLVMDPKTGNVLAYLEPLSVTGETFSDSGYQPGSLLTPFAAAAAFARGYSPASLLWDIPSSASSAVNSVNTIVEYHGAVNIRSAVANDYLNPIASLIKNVGPANVWLTASAAGISALNNASYDTSPLFTDSESSLLQIGEAYSTLANSGVRSGASDPQTSEISPNTVRRVVTSTGRVLIAESATAENSILSQPLAYLVNHILSDENARWASLGYPNVLEIGSPVAAKVGSSANGHQVWTVGYTAQRLVLIWMGDKLEENSATDLNSRMAAGIWHAVFRYAARDQQFAGWEAPSGITEMKVCSPSGMLPTADCPNVVSDVFLVGNEPTIADTLYVRIKVNRETGLRATVFTQPDMVEEKVFMDVPPEAREWALAAGLPVAPQGYDSIQHIQTDPNAQISDPAIFSSVSGKVIVRGTADGEKFASYTLQVGEGINPDNWLQINENTSKPVTDGVLAEWDTGGLNGLFALRLTVVDAENLIKTAVTQVTVDNTPPTVKITYPQADQKVKPVRGSVTLTASAEDLVGIGKVEWWVDGKLASTQTAAPFVYQLTAQSGKHKALVKTWDLAGNSAQSAEVSFEIQP